MIDIELKHKHTFFGDRRPIKTEYRVRTGNSHGPTKDKLPALRPCKRAKAGAKVFLTHTQTPSPRTLVVDGLTGKRRFVKS